MHLYETKKGEDAVKWRSSAPTLTIPATITASFE
jgi:hypothetical protein